MRVNSLFALVFASALFFPSGACAPAAQEAYQSRVAHYVYAYCAPSGSHEALSRTYRANAREELSRMREAEPTRWRMLSHTLYEQALSISQTGNCLRA